MTRTTRLSLFVLAALILVAFIGEVSAFRERSDVILPTQQQGLTTLKDNGFDIAMRIRGGAVAIEIESSDEEETDDEEEEDVPKIAKATKKAAKKAAKKSVAAAMKPKKKKSSLSNFFRVPYIVKACLNPVVFFQMVGGYWKSLYNINYLADKSADSSQDLRSALEQKARYGGGGKKPSRGKRKMKPGQAKTLSDLPQLNT